MVQIIQENPEPKFIDRFSNGIASMGEQAPQSIYDMISLHQQQKKQAYKNKETLSKNLPKYLKDRHPALAANPKKIKEIEAAAEKYLNDYEPLDALRLGIEEIEKPKKGSLQDNKSVFGLPDSQETSQGWLEQLSQAQEGGKPGIFEQLVKSRKEPLDSGNFAASLGLGAIQPFADLENLMHPETHVLNALGRKQPTHPMDLARKKLRQNLSPDQIEQAEATEFVSSLIPWGSIIGSFAKTTKLGSFWKNAQKAAKAEGISVEKAAENLTKKAVDVGVDVSKVAAGDVSEVKKLNEFSKKLNLPEEAKTQRTFKETPKANVKEEAKLRETQTKVYPKYAEEVSADQAKLAKIEGRMKMPSTIAKEETVRKTAQAEIPKLRELSIRAGKRRRDIENGISKLEGSELNRAQTILKESVGYEKEADRALRNAIHAAETGEARASTAELQKQIADSLKKIEEHAGKLDEPLGSVFKKTSPQQLERQEQIKKLSPLPGKPYEDEYMRIKNAYKDAYDKRLSSISNELKEAHYLPPAEVEGLKREQKILQDRVKGIEADVQIHGREQGLRELQKAKSNKEKLEKAKPTKEGGKVEKVAHEKIKEALKDLDSPEAEKLAQKAGIKKEDLRSALNDMKKGTEKIAKDSKNSSKLHKNLKEFLNEIQQKNYWKALSKTAIGKDILWTIGAIAVEEAFDKKVPYSAFGTVLFGSSATRGLRTLLLLGYRSARKAQKKNSYLNDIEKGDDEKVAKFQKEHPKWAKEARESRY